MAYQYNPKTLGFVRTPPPPPPITDPYDMYTVNGQTLDPNSVYNINTPDGPSTVATGSIATGGGMSAAAAQQLKEAQQNALATPEQPGATKMWHDTQQMGDPHRPGPAGQEWGNRPPPAPAQSEEWITPPKTIAPKPTAKPPLASFDDVFRDRDRAPAQQTNAGKPPAQGQQTTPKATTAEELAPGSEKVSKMPAPPGYAYAVNPLTKAIELVDTSPLDPTQPLAGWKWIVNDPNNQNDGRWVFVPTPDVLDKPWEGIPSSVVGWLQQGLSAGGDLSGIPEGPARSWVQFLMSQSQGKAGRAPEELPFGMGLPKFNMSNSGFPTPPDSGSGGGGSGGGGGGSGGTGAFGRRLREFVKANGGIGGDRTELRGALREFISEVREADRTLPMPVSIDESLRDLGLTDAQIQELLTLWILDEDSDGVPDDEEREGRGRDDDDDARDRRRMTIQI